MSVKQYLCGPCLEDKAEIEGVVYCRECEEPLCGQCKQDHGRIKVSKQHKLCDLADVPPKEIQALLKSLIACSSHKKEEVLYLCKDHDTTCCTKCAMADHRKCEELQVLDDILHDIKVDCTGLKTVLHDLQKRGERLLEHERKHEEWVSEIESKALSSLLTIKQKLLDIFAQIENNVLSAIADKKKVIAEKIKTNNKRSSQFLNDVKQHSAYIEHVEKFGTNKHVVLLQRRLENDSVCRLKSTVGELEERKCKSSFKFVEDTSFDSLLIEMKNSFQIKSFDVSETGFDTDNSQYKPYTERSPQLQYTKDLRSIPMLDKNVWFGVTSCIWIDEYIVIYFRELNALFVIKEDGDSVLSKFMCYSSSLSVSKTGPNDMVITMPYKRKIAFAQLRYGNVHVVAELKTRVPYKEVTRNTALNQYICMSNISGQIDILHNDGTLLRTICLSTALQEYVAYNDIGLSFNPTNHMLIMSHYNSNKLIAFNLNGKTVFEYKHPDLIGPRQLAIDPSGNVYVASFRGNIHHTSPSGQTIRSLWYKNDDHSPSGICFNSTCDKIALVDTGYEDYKNKKQTLRVYTYT